MSKVKVIDLKSHIENTSEQKYTSYRDNISKAVLEGPKGVIAINDDASYQLLESIDDTIHIEVALNDGNIKFAPEGMADEKLSVLLTDAPVTEQPLNEYVLTFDEYIEECYNELLKSIKKIGLNPDDFKRKQ